MQNRKSQEINHGKIKLIFHCVPVTDTLNNTINTKHEKHLKQKCLKEISHELITLSDIGILVNLIFTMYEKYFHGSLKPHSS